MHLIKWPLEFRPFAGLALDFIVVSFIYLGVVQKLRLQKEGVDSPKMLIFVDVHKVKNLNGGG